MKNYFLLLSCIISTLSLFGQNAEYFTLTQKADSLYNAKEFKSSALAYSAAFKVNGETGTVNDRYNAACSWALANSSDSAFFQLYRIAKKANYKNYGHITIDTDLSSLHNDKRWIPLLEIIKENKEKAEVNLYRTLVSELDSIITEDQKYRLQIDVIEKKYGWGSNELKANYKIMEQKDSINLMKVKAILDKFGWLGADIIGEEGNQTLFLVIQHSDIVTQEKYLPMMREAVKNGKAKGSELALLEDRVALRHGKRQIYGSQIGRDEITKQYYVSPLEDPDNVDKRRAAVGLEPLANYVDHWQIKWDVANYKKYLQTIEAK